MSFNFSKNNIPWLMPLIGLLFILGITSVFSSMGHEIQKMNDRQFKASSLSIKNHIENMLHSTEDVAYSLSSKAFSDTHRGDDGLGHVSSSKRLVDMTSEDKIFESLESALNMNTKICGIAVGLQDPEQSGFTSHQYGYACYVTNIEGPIKRLQLGDINDYRNREWYKDAYQTRSACWSHPFRETSSGKVESCFSLPFYVEGRCAGVAAFDIDTERLRRECLELVPFKNTQIFIVDSDNRVAAHSDSTMLLEIVNLAENNDDFISFVTNIDANGWTVYTRIPKKEIYANSRQSYFRAIGFSSAFFLVLTLLMYWFTGQLSKAVRKNAGIESELGIASDIQMDLLKQTPPECLSDYGYEISSYLKPAKDVGGDLYDYCVHDGKLFFCVGDVSGKGIPASLIMMVVLSLFRNKINDCDSPAEIMSSINSSVAYENKRMTFCTLFVGVLDLASGKLTYCNAGHNLPVLKNKSLESDPDLPVGVFGDISYEDNSADLNSGDVLFVYTDGVTEAVNVSDEMYGDQRLLDSLNKIESDSGVSASDIHKYVLSDLSRFTHGANQSDDITMMVIKRK